MEEPPSAAACRPAGKRSLWGKQGKRGDLLTRSGTRRTTSCQGGIGRVAGNQGVAEGGIGL